MGRIYRLRTHRMLKRSITKNLAEMSTPPCYVNFQRKTRERGGHGVRLDVTPAAGAVEVSIELPDHLVLGG